MALKIKLVDDWRRAHKFASIWWSLVGILLMILELLNQTWLSLPPAIQDKLPNSTWISLTLFIFVTIARVLVLIKPDANNEN